MGALFPVTLELQEKIKTGKAGDDEYMELSYESQSFGFVIGYLVGCKSMGASHSEMMDKAEAFTLNDVNWRRWKAESEEES
jgi:hypothetical protein